MENLLRLGASFAALMADYRAVQSQLAALQHEADRTAADAGLVYGSSAWSEHRFAITGRTVHYVNELYGKLEDLAQQIAPIRPACFAGLLIKARAHQFAGNPAAIIIELEALALASNQRSIPRQGNFSGFCFLETDPALVHRGTDIVRGSGRRVSCQLQGPILDHWM